MNYGSVAIAYEEPRFIVPHLMHLPIPQENRLVLNSINPWNGVGESNPETAFIAEAHATVIRSSWPTEESQRNTGQDIHLGKDWVIVLDPDEFLTRKDWDTLFNFLENTDADAVVCEGQYTYWKNGYVADPPKDYQQLIAVRPHVQFVDKRVVGTGFKVAPVWVHHFSWARTNEEVLNKINHFAHADELDWRKWYEEVWLKWTPEMFDVHPKTPETLHKMIPATLPYELEELNLWPN